MYKTTLNVLALAGVLMCAGCVTPQNSVTPTIQVRNISANAILNDASAILDTAKAARESYVQVYDLYRKAKGKVTQLTTLHAGDPLVDSLLAGQVTISGFLYNDFMALEDELSVLADSESDPLAGALFLSGEYDKLQIWEGFVYRHHAAGEDSLTYKYLDKLLVFGDTSSHGSHKENAINKAIHVYLNLGLFDKGVSLARTSFTQEKFDDNFLFMSLRFAKEGEFNIAERLLELLKHLPEEKLSFTFNEFHLLRGNNNLALKYFDTAIKDAHTIENNYNRSRRLFLISKSYGKLALKEAELNLLDEALSISINYYDNAWRFELFDEIILRYIALGKHDHLLDLMNQSDCDAVAKDIIINRVVTDLIEQKSYERALQLIEQINVMVSDKAYLIGKIGARILGSDGATGNDLIRRAQIVIDGLEPKYGELIVNVYGSISSWIIAKEHPQLFNRSLDQLFDQIEALEDQRNGLHTLLYLSGKSLANGQREIAEIFQEYVLNKINDFDGSIKGYLLLGIALNYVELGDYQIADSLYVEAIKLLPFQSYPDYHEYHKASFSNAYIAKGEFLRGIRAIGQLTIKEIQRKGLYGASEGYLQAGRQPSDEEKEALKEVMHQIYPLETFWADRMN